MTKDEALKLALEALENAKDICIALQEYGIRAGKSAKEMRVGEVLIHDRAITAIKEALENAQRKSFSDAQINEIRLVQGQDIEDSPQSWDFRQGFRAAEQAHGIEE